MLIYKALCCREVAFWFNVGIMPTSTDFSNYCCDLLASAGRCVSKRMFGGYALGMDGLTIAILADLGDGKKLWLKNDGSTCSRYEAAAAKYLPTP